MNLHKDLTLKTFLIFTMIFQLALVSIGCSSVGKVYSKDEIAKELERICRDEYKMDVKARFANGTLAGYLEVDYFYPEEIRYKSGSDFKRKFSLLLSKYKRLDKEIERKVNNFLVAITRVALSTDAEVDFFESVILDKQNGIERVYIGTINDAKRLKYSDISLGEGSKRILYNTRLNPRVVGEQIVRELFSDLSTMPHRKLVSTYFLNTNKNDSLNKSFFAFLREASYKKSMDFKIETLNARQISKNQAVVRCEVLQSFIPKESFASYTFMYPQKFKNEYVFLVDTADLVPKFGQTIILYKGIKEGLGKIVINDQIIEYLGPSIEADARGDGLFFEQMELPDFLASQIAQRIIYEFALHKNMRKDFLVVYSDGSYIASPPGGETDQVLSDANLTVPSDNVFSFKVNISEKKNIDLASLFKASLKSKKDSDPFSLALEGFLNKLSETSTKHYYTKKDLNTLIIKVIADVLHSYKFKDFSKIELFNLAYSERVLIDKDDLWSYRKKVKFK